MHVKDFAAALDCERIFLLLTKDAARKHVSAPSAALTAITTSWHMRYRDCENFQNVSVRGFSGFMVYSEWLVVCQQPS